MLRGKQGTSRPTCLGLGVVHVVGPGFEVLQAAHISIVLSWDQGLVPYLRRHLLPTSRTNDSP